LTKESLKLSDTAAQEKILQLETEVRELETRQLELSHELERLKEVAHVATAKYNDASQELSAARKEAQEARSGTCHYLMALCIIICSIRCLTRVLFVSKLSLALKK
jgi:outer membrane murein-binding lipoprotein Lpp